MSETRIISESISGVRGIYGQGIDVNYARIYARIFILTLSKENKSVVLGADTRKSSKELLDIFIEEFKLAGFHVYDLDFTTTPVAQFAVRCYKAAGGVMITASHNQPEYNGWKLLDDTGAVLGPDIMKDVINKVHAVLPEKLSFPRTRESRKLNHQSNDWIPDQVGDDTCMVVDKHVEVISKYLDEVFKILTPEGIEKIKEKSYKLAVDPNGSAVWEVMEEFCQKLHVKLIGINTKQGVFNRVIEPTHESLIGLTEIVDKELADFGCGFDCDADRVEIVLASDSEYAKNNGVMVSGQYVLALGVDSILSKADAGNIVVTNFATSNIVHDIASRFNTRVKEVDVGEVNVVNAMTSNSAIIGGEGSSSGVIVGGTTCRDGIMVIGLILRLLAEQNKSLDQILSSYPVYYEERIKASCNADKVEVVREKLLNYYTEKGVRTLTDDEDKTSGIKALYPDGLWVFFRASKTEAGIFRIIVNGKDEKLVNEYLVEAEIIFNSLV